MKTKLFATTALVAAFGMGATGAQAQEAGEWSITLGGYSNFMVGFADQDNATAGNTPAVGGAQNAGGTGFHDSDFDFSTDSEISFTAEITLDNGILVGFDSELIADSGSNEDGGSADEAKIYLDGSFGRVELGHDDGAQDNMHYGATNVKAVYVGTFNNTTGSLVNFVGGAPLLTNFNDTGDNTKATYFTPRIAGLQAGFTYTPDSDQDSFAPRRNANTNTDGYEAGVNYINSFNGFDVAASVTGTFRNHSTTTANVDGEDWNVTPGFVVGYGGFEFGTSLGFGENNERDQFAVDAGVGYSTGPWAVSLTGIYSELDDIPAGGNNTVEDEFYEVNAGINYALGPGVSIFTSAAVGEFEQSGQVAGNARPDNEYFSLVSGVGVSF